MKYFARSTTILGRNHARIPQTPYQLALQAMLVHSLCVMCSFHQLIIENFPTSVLMATLHLKGIACATVMNAMGSANPPNVQTHHMACPDESLVRLLVLLVTQCVVSPTSTKAIYNTRHRERVLTTLLNELTNALRRGVILKAVSSYCCRC